MLVATAATLALPRAATAAAWRVVAQHGAAGGRRLLWDAAVSIRALA